MAVALLAIIVANSPWATAYFSSLHIYVGPLSVQHWINDALMAAFFLMVGLEIKRCSLTSLQARSRLGFSATPSCASHTVASLRLLTHECPSVGI